MGCCVQGDTNAGTIKGELQMVSQTHQVTHGMLGLRRGSGKVQSGLITLGGETGVSRLEQTVGTPAGSPKLKARGVTGRRGEKFGR